MARWMGTGSFFQHFSIQYTLVKTLPGGMHKCIPYAKIVVVSALGKCHPGCEAANQLHRLGVDFLGNLCGPGVETSKKFDKAAIEAALKALDTEKYGMILRAKGILPAVDGTWIHFDYVPEEADIRTGSPDITGKLCVIGSKLDEAAIAALFGV